MQDVWGTLSTCDNFEAVRAAAHADLEKYINDVLFEVYEQGMAFSRRIHTASGKL